MFRNRSILVALAVLSLVLVVSVVAILLNSNPNQSDTSSGNNQQDTSNQQPDSQPPDAEQPNTTVGEGEVDPFLGNLNLLTEIYTDAEYFFINQTVQEFARDRLGKGLALEIDPISLNKRSDRSYGFSVRDKISKGRLFYVIVTKELNGNLTVEEFL